MTLRTRWLLSVFALVTALLLVLLQSRYDSVFSRSESADMALSEKSSLVPRAASSGLTSDAPSLASASGALHSARPSTRPDAGLRNQWRESLMRKWQASGIERDPHTGLTIPAGPAGHSQNLTREYVQQRVRKDFIPLATSCYEAALVHSPHLRGKVVIDFMIVGDPSVGGLVDQAKLNDATTLRDSALVECMLNSMLSMVFEAPDDYGWVTISYPFELSPDNEPGPVTE